MALSDSRHTHEHTHTHKVSTVVTPRTHVRRVLTSIPTLHTHAHWYHTTLLVPCGTTVSERVYT